MILFIVQACKHFIALQLILQTSVMFVCHIRATFFPANIISAQAT